MALGSPLSLLKPQAVRRSCSLTSHQESLQGQYGLEGLLGSPPTRGTARGVEVPVGAAEWGEAG